MGAPCQEFHLVKKRREERRAREGRGRGGRVEGGWWESKVGKTPVITLYTAVAAQLPLSSAHNTTQQMIRPAATQELQLLREPPAPSEAEAANRNINFSPFFFSFSAPLVPNLPHMRPRGSASGGEPPRSVTAPVNRPKVSKAAFFGCVFTSRSKFSIFKSVDGTVSIHGGAAEVFSFCTSPTDASSSLQFASWPLDGFRQWAGTKQRQCRSSSATVKPGGGGGHRMPIIL